MRYAIVQDKDGLWFVRSLVVSVHDWEADEMVYRCDKHLAGPFDEVIDAAHWVIDNEEPEGGPVLVKMTADGPKAV